MTCKNCGDEAVPQTRVKWATPVCCRCVKPSAKELEELRKTATECSICRSVHGEEIVHACE